MCSDANSNVYLPVLCYRLRRVVAVPTITQSAISLQGYPFKMLLVLKHSSLLYQTSLVVAIWSVKYLHKVRAAPRYNLRNAQLTLPRGILFDRTVTDERANRKMVHWNKPSSQNSRGQVASKTGCVYRERVSNRPDVRSDSALLYVNWGISSLKLTGVFGGRHISTRSLSRTIP